MVLTISPFAYCRLTQNLLICSGSALTVPVHEPSCPARASILPGIPSTAFLAADAILMPVPGREGCYSSCLFTGNVVPVPTGYLRRAYRFASSQDGLSVANPNGGRS